MTAKGCEYMCYEIGSKTFRQGPGVPLGPGGHWVGKAIIHFFEISFGSRLKGHGWIGPQLSMDHFSKICGR